MPGVSFFSICATASAGTAASVPLGALYCVAALEKADIETEFFDYQLSNIPAPVRPETIKTFLEQARFDILAISCWENLLPSVLLATRLLKREYPELTIILGGMGPTGMTREILKLFPHVDFIVRGAGEDALPRIVQHREHPEKLVGVPGICFRNRKDELVCSNSVATLPPVDLLPWPAYHKVDLSRYGRVQIASSRGCPYRCDFCSIPGQWGNRCHFRDIDKFIEEVEFLHSEKEIPRIHIIDDTFLASPHRALKFCAEIRSRCPSLKWTCYSRIDLMDEATCETMAASGCDNVFYGVESGSNAILKRLGKRFDTDRAIDVIRLSNRYFHVVASFLWGLPYEALDDFSKTIILMSYLAEEIESNIDLQLFFVAPLALSKLQSEYREQLRFSPEFWSFFTWGEDFQGSGPEVINLVRSHIDIFPGLGYFDSPDLEEKIGLGQKLGLVSSLSHSIK